MSSARRLRDAAKVLRKGAEKATCGPWRVVGALVGSPIGDVTYYADDSDAVYIATMHPGVGLALADWLDDEYMQQNGPTEHAITIADLILGGNQ
ncbi:hypothetical protein ACI3EY_16815 [Ornithinimicrobium sp. LYQ92]|uniref:hypothetical protein n=1 Tax=Serinicoccus sp. LYQ92 TaxID=3378798 RepID=UPI0038518526